MLVQRDTCSATQEDDLRQSCVTVASGAFLWAGSLSGFAKKEIKK